MGVELSSELTARNEALSESGSGAMAGCSQAALRMHRPSRAARIRAPVRDAPAPLARSCAESSDAPALPSLECARDAYRVAARNRDRAAPPLRPHPRASRPQVRRWRRPARLVAGPWGALVP